MIVVWSRTGGAIRMPRTHHQATRGDITPRSAAAPHSAKHAPPLEGLCLCVVLWPSGVGLVLLFINSIFLLAKKSIITKRGVVSC